MSKGHYQLPLPWKDPTERLPNNFDLAHKRLENLVKCLKRDDLFSRYDAEISKLLQSGYAEVVPKEAILKLGRLWYLPHHMV